MGSIFLVLGPHFLNFFVTHSTRFKMLILVINYAPYEPFENGRRDFINIMYYLL